MWAHDSWSAQDESTSYKKCTPVPIWTIMNFSIFIKFGRRNSCEIMAWMSNQHTQHYCNEMQFCIFVNITLMWSKSREKCQIQSEPHNELFTFYQIWEMQLCIFFRDFINVIKIARKYQIQSELHNELFTFYQILEMSYLQNNWFFMILHQCDWNHEKNIKFNLNFIMNTSLFIKYHTCKIIHIQLALLSNIIWINQVKIKILQNRIELFWNQISA